MTVEEVRGSLDLTDNGAIRNSIRNCLTVFQNDPNLQGAIRYNILTERIDIVKPLLVGEAHSDPERHGLQLPHALSGGQVRTDQRKED